ncbi:EmrE family multidrug efflux SMR transporter [Delftia tsuruhatensis]|uniref:Small multidrug resistance pump n=1 Tax=Paracidovorax wautersii TaxID=1177982 RepID=A0A1I2B4U6_9BURK|nr:MULTISPECIES: EmrE family multidrug efflux SMR transporter [Comamonadaceae]MDH2233621.1 EmrE family multidrug efflux SMR transporter [Delftia tsuruhatensis]SFE51222.1 small multidrug resistance pump [Paracidovorax wautersii]
MNSYVFLGGAIALEVVGTTFMKTSEGFTRLWPSVAAVVSYAVCFYLLSQTLKEIPTGIAYAIWSGCGIVLISLIAWLLHGQKLDLAAIAGIGLIVAGVIVLNLFSKSAAH